MRIIVDNHIPFLDGLLEAVAEVVYAPGSDITPALVRQADALFVRTRTRCDSTLLEGSKVQFVGTATIGTDHIDRSYCRSRGITVASAPGCNAPAVAQWVMSTVLRHISHSPLDRQVIGIVGVGHVGSIVARWAKQLGFEVLLCDPPRQDAEGGNQWTDLNTLARHSRIITFHTPLTRDGSYPTWHLCDSEMLRHATHCRLLLNAARGAVTDTQALLKWNGTLAIDCWEGEPEINLELLEKASVATPHIAGYSIEGKQRATAMIVAELNRHFGWHLPVMMPKAPANGAQAVTSCEITTSYRPADDTKRLKEQPTLFEQFRNTYRLRHEVGA